MLTAADIFALYQSRQAKRTPAIRRMEIIRDTYNGDLIVPLPEIDTDQRIAVANLISSGIDQLAGRIASTQPMTYWPSTKPGVRQHDRRAATRRVAQAGWWQHNRMKLKLRHRARHLIGYGSSPLMVRAGVGGDLPSWEIVNPLTVFAAPVDHPDCFTPYDVITKRERTRGWLTSHGYADALTRVKDDPPKMQTNDDVFVLLEYADEQQWAMVVLGRTIGDFSGGYGEEVTELFTTENPMGMCPLVMPIRVTMDRNQGQFDQALPMYEMQARLMNLEIAAVEKGIFPDTYLVSRAGEVGRIIDGPYDGRSGKLTVVAGGDVVDKGTNPGYQTNPTIDRLERAQRLTAGIPAEFGGESGSNIRTGRRGQDVFSGVVEVPIQEAQEILCASMEEENKRAAALEKALHKGKTRHVFVTGLGKATQQTYIPDEVFNTDKNIVSYPAVGTDLNGLVISMGQRVGIGMMSKRTGMEMDPLIDDPETEMDQVTAEALEGALLSAIQQQAQAGTIPPADVARIAELVRSDRLELAAAVTKVQEEAQQRQATPMPEGSPETMPGLAQPGMGAEAPPSIAPPPQSAQNLSQLFTALRRPTQQVAAEQAV